MLRQFRHKLVSQCTDLGNQERPLSAQTSGCGDPIWTRNRKYVQKNGYEFWLPISIKKAEGVCSRPLSVLAYHRVKFRLTRKVALCVNSTPLLNRPRFQLKSVHFKKSVTQSSFLAKSVVIFSDFVLISVKMTTLFARNENRVTDFLKWTNFRCLNFCSRFYNNFTSADFF